MHHQNFISIEVAVQELGRGGHPTPSLGQGVGQKHLGWARVKTIKKFVCRLVMAWAAGEVFNSILPSYRADTILRTVETLSMPCCFGELITMTT